MPILAVDQMGRIYQTSGDRSDGLGFGSYPESRSQKDLTLGNAYLKAQAKRSGDVIRRKKAQELHDSREQVARAMGDMKLRDQQMKAEAEARAHRNPHVQQALLKKAIGMGCTCDSKTAFGASALTANGQRGWAGMSRDQQIIHNAVLGMGRDMAPPPDKRLIEMREAKAKADQILRLKARPGQVAGRTRVR